MGERPIPSSIEGSPPHVVQRIRGFGRAFPPPIASELLYGSGGCIKHRCGLPGPLDSRRANFGARPVEKPVRKPYGSLLPAPAARERLPSSMQPIAAYHAPAVTNKR